MLATHPNLLWDAQKSALAKYAQVVTAADLPAEIISGEPLPSSPKNVYGVYPPLNTWEKPFAELLDRSPKDSILWWHRNEPRKPWSVNVLMPDGRGFFPDFVLGVEGRKTEDKILLVDPKYYFATDNEAPKVLAEHKIYGKVLILYLEGGTRWMTVKWDTSQARPRTSDDFRIADAAGF
jgi:hypothetical protein